MAASTDALERETKLQGLGSSRLRKEDARFIRGKGSYVDDIKLPGMLHGAMVRSPYAHATSSRSTRPRPWRCRESWRSWWRRI